MKIKNYPIEKLIEAEYNPRRLTEDQFQQISDSIKRFGIVDPAIINTHKERKNIIVGGHQRIKVAKKLGIKEMPCVEVSLTPDQERELNIRLNKNTGEWNYDILANYFDIHDLEDWGFSDFELNFSNIDEEIDYSIVDEENLDDELAQLQNESKKAVCIEFHPEHYEEANELIKFWREQSGDIGLLILEHLRAEKQKL